MQLLLFARQHRLATREESLGRCLHATVLLARESRLLDLDAPTYFLRWIVKDDPDFREHWALSWRPGLALDMAAAQVDGDAQPLRPIASYPPNYVALGRYPVEPILACLSGPPHGIGSRYGARQMLCLHRCLMGIELRRARRATSLAAATRAVLRFAQAAYVLARLTQVLMKSS